ncbi:DUF6882 domain-containing protein [Antricoccus suffuscus]|uniref:DUF6882 domain-containing protein n=1 Tax=Antricoccus suffuscus TaxID=1629062 RepID=UPI0011B286E1|nr:DUF6882 domain-containing protein [Antricoccus suffuscus]
MIDKPTLDVMAAAYAAVVAERQIAFERLAVAEIWTADLDDRQLHIGDRTFEVSFLGSAADAEGTWLWGWANAAFGVDHVATAPISELVTIGQKYDVPELTTPSLPLSALANPGIHGPGHGPGDTLAVVACGLLDGSAYYAGEYEGGTAYMLVTDASVPRPPVDVAGLPLLIQSATAMFPHDHRLTVETYLGVHGIEATTYGEFLTAHFDSGETISFTFDERGELTDLTRS